MGIPLTDDEWLFLTLTEPTVGVAAFCNDAVKIKMPEPFAKEGYLPVLPDNYVLKRGQTVIMRSSDGTRNVWRYHEG